MHAASLALGAPCSLRLRARAHRPHTHRFRGRKRVQWCFLRARAGCDRLSPWRSGAATRPRGCWVGPGEHLGGAAGGPHRAAAVQQEAGVGRGVSAAGARCCSEPPFRCLRSPALSGHQARRPAAPHPPLSQEERRLAKVQAETAAAREARVVPQDNPKALVEFLLNTDAQEMTFEVARVRPQLVRT